MLRKLLCFSLMALIFSLNGCGNTHASQTATEDTISLLTQEFIDLPDDLQETDSNEDQITLPESSSTENQVTLPETNSTEDQIIFPEKIETPDTILTPEMILPPKTAETEHSEYYIPGLEVEDLLTYFNEVVLDAEFINSGNASVVQKWDVKVKYYIHGDPTQTDITILESTATWLNSIYGFPGMEEAQSESDANLQIHFVNKQDLISLMGNQYENSDGGVNFHYSSNRIYKEIICIRTDIDQYIRNSVIQEEIYNGMGPVQDTDLRFDSMIYRGYSTPQEMTDVDKLIMTLLYHPDIDYGMNAEECETVIRQLYY